MRPDTYSLTSSGWVRPRLNKNNFKTTRTRCQYLNRLGVLVSEVSHHIRRKSRRVGRGRRDHQLLHHLRQRQSGTHGNSDRKGDEGNCNPACLPLSALLARCSSFLGLRPEKAAGAGSSAPLCALLLLSQSLADAPSLGHQLQCSTVHY